MNGKSTGPQAEQSIRRTHALRAAALLLAGACALVPLLQGCAPAVVAGAATASAVIVGDPRSPETIVRDQKIEFKANDTIYSNYDLGTQVHVNVTSYNRRVLLTGEALSEDLRERAETAVRGLDGVQDVYNELAIGESSDIQSRSNDAWITSKVKGWLLRSNEVNTAYIKVITERGNVYLMGIVTQAQADAAAEIASRVEGVDRVVKVFEYREVPEISATK